MASKEFKSTSTSIRERDKNVKIGLFYLIFIVKLWLFNSVGIDFSNFKCKGFSDTPNSKMSNITVSFGYYDTQTTPKKCVNKIYTNVMQ